MSYTFFEILGITGRGLLVGLSTGPSCLGHCGPLIVPYILGEGGRVGKNLRTILKFFLGRLFGYLLVGFISGYAGMSLRNFVEGKLMGIAVILSSLLLILYGVGKKFSSLPLCHIVTSRKGLSQLPLIFGFLTGFNLCPAFLLGFSHILAVGNPLGGVMFFLAFFIATLIYLIPLLFLSFIDSDKVRKFGQVAALVAGVWFLYLGVNILL